MKLEYNENSGEYLLESTDVNIKIDSSRNVYLKIPKRNQSQFVCTEVQVPKGMKREQKFQWMYATYVLIQEKLDNSIEEPDDSSNDKVEDGNNTGEV